MTTTIFNLVGGPWDGQTLSTAADDEANACFAQALWALTGGRVGCLIPLIAPAGQARIDKGISSRERAAIKPHAYEITAAVRKGTVLRVTARHRHTG